MERTRACISERPPEANWIVPLPSLLAHVRGCFRLVVSLSLSARSLALSDSVSSSLLFPSAYLIRDGSLCLRCTDYYLCPLSPSSSPALCRSSRQTQPRLGTTYTFCFSPFDSYPFILDVVSAQLYYTIPPASTVLDLSGLVPSLRDTIYYSTDSSLPPYSLCASCPFHLTPLPLIACTCLLFVFPYLCSPHTDSYDSLPHGLGGPVVGTAPQNIG